MLFLLWNILVKASLFTVTSSSSHTRLTDQELLKQFYINHNNEYLGALLERYTLLLYGVSMKYLKNAEESRDAVQQIFLKVITELHKYEVTYFSSWLYMIAKNHCLMTLRKQRHITSMDLVTEPVSEMEDADPLKDESIFNELNAAITHLNREQKNCIRMFYIEKKSYREISSETGYNLLQVK